MKTIFFYLSLFICQNLFAQQQTYDLISYTPPPKKEWTKEEKNNVIVYSKIDNANKTWWQMGLYKSTTSKGNIEEDLKSEWNELVEKFYKTTGPMKVTDSYEGEGWKIKTATGKFTFNNQPASVMLTTFSGYTRCISVVATTNSSGYTSSVQDFIDNIDFKPEAIAKISNNNQTIEPVKNNTTVSNGSFAFTTTNFDDGWTSTVQEDWVEVTKGNIKVLLHFPKDGTIFPADPEPLTNNAWNILVAPRYSSLKNYRTAYITTYNRPYLGMGTVTDKSGKQLYVVLYRQGDSGWMEFICPDKNSFIKQFGFDPEAIRWDSDSELMNVLYKLKFYNKFAVAASDFKGKWTSDFTGIQQLYYVYTGQYAGMNINQSNEEFIFNGNTYNWKLLVINGMVGNTKFNQVASSGTFTVPNNWQLSFTKIETGPKTYNAFWSCIKGARILNLLDAQYPGSGIYTQFGLSNK